MVFGMNNLFIAFASCLCKSALQLWRGYVFTQDMHPIEFYVESEQLRRQILEVITDRQTNPNPRPLSTQLYESLFASSAPANSSASTAYGDPGRETDQIKLNSNYQYGGSSASSTRSTPGGRLSGTRSNHGRAAGTASVMLERSRNLMAKFCLAQNDAGGGPGADGRRQARSENGFNGRGGGGNTRNSRTSKLFRSTFGGKRLTRNSFESNEGAGAPNVRSDLEILQNYLRHDCETALSKLVEKSKGNTSSNTASTTSFHVKLGTKTTFQRYEALVESIVSEYSDLGHLETFFEVNYPNGMREEQFGWFLVQMQDENSLVAKEVFSFLKPPWKTSCNAASIASNSSFGATSAHQQYQSQNTATSSMLDQLHMSSFDQTANALNKFGLRRWLCDASRNCICSGHENNGGSGATSLNLGEDSFIEDHVDHSLIEVDERTLDYPFASMLCKNVCPHRPTVKMANLQHKCPSFGSSA
ncbi:unnamed protein product [Amoebophrya sp. A120]|nr:unnamed protein product [Amoebophrya sp. A120]|eukprot:GSA120T00010091001.1